MDSRWDGKRAAGYGDDLLALRAYSSRLLGANSDLVLHGGGNTSVKIDGVDLHGEPQRLLYVKGSGWDLASIEPAGFAPLRIEPVRRLAELESLSDSDMMRSLRSASVDPDAPAPSVETITHALVPHRFVDHTHADAVVTISNTSDGADRLRDLYGDEVLVVPYAMPGFVLARLIADLTAGVDWASLRGMVLMNHGVFTFADDARASYEAMIEIVSRAEAAVAGSLHAVAKSSSSSDEGDLLKLATLRRAVSEAAGKAMIARLNDSDGAVGFAGRRDAGELAGRGCLTPDHVLHTKPSPVVVGDEPAADVAEFGRQYEAYFSRNAGPEHTQLDPAPRWAIWPGAGIVGFGPTAGRAGIVADITAQAISAMQVAEVLAGWDPPCEKDLFDVEYWELEQAKLFRAGPAPPLQGKIALVTGAASGIGRACAEVLLAQGAAVAALDVNPAVGELFDSDAAAGFVCDVTDSAAVDTAVDGVIRRFGGLDIIVANAGTFPPEAPIDELEVLLAKTDLDAIPVVTKRGRFVGVVSRQGVLNSKLDEKQRLLDEAQRWQSSAENDRACRRAALDASLTEREREVLALMLDGVPTKNIARRLGIAFNTARNHRTSIYRKLGVGNVLELISLLSPANDIRGGVLNVRQAADASNRGPNPPV
ncbi:MAG: SDR family NAD(P)-dependent oxidoreductase [Chloroflexi bacterium]|nr:SDR family NAD(P)-dependent oxidoreductase [Chloroflexota bacterium]